MINIQVLGLLYNHLNDIGWNGGIVVHVFQRAGECCRGKMKSKFGKVSVTASGFLAFKL